MLIVKWKNRLHKEIKWVYLTWCFSETESYCSRRLLFCYCFCPTLECNVIVHVRFFVFLVYSDSLSSFEFSILFTKSIAEHVVRIQREYKIKRCHKIIVQISFLVFPNPTCQTSIQMTSLWLFLNLGKNIYIVKAARILTRDVTYRHYTLKFLLICS